MLECYYKSVTAACMERLREQAERALVVERAQKAIAIAHAIP